MRDMNCPLETILAQIGESRKYRHIAPQVVARIAHRTWERTRRDLKATIKETKNALHQVAGAYFRSAPRYEAWQAAFESGQAETVLPDILATHASVAERDIATLPDFYAQVFAHLDSPRSIIDLACGLHPVAFATYAPFAKEITYYAGDIYTDLEAFLNGVFPAFGIQGRAFTCDLLGEGFASQIAEEIGEVDVAFLFKILPLLELWEKGASARLLHALPVRQIVITYPTRSLGGNACGMARNYAQHLAEITAETNWQVEALEFPRELCFVVTK